MKVYIVIDIGYDCRNEKEVLGVFDSRQKAEDFAITTAVEQFTLGRVPVENRTVSFYKDTDNIAGIFDEADYYVDIEIVEQEVQ